ncbi:CPBP family intramembrane glutamic endopeptidase [Staphylococcus delphini]|uniref:CPBP family intramembrane glutamic endopeptidase n=1 Tax=Staphylococcus delphini TaxID=53344 RepID=UPI000BBBF057|nr:CPBP family intramembrane glutamic endopeptidase [Staphylococcus delphini]PCF41632.1 CPBP family intramembrane metalloprotease [Staphylococcus delphini]
MTTLSSERGSIHYRDFIIVPVFILLQYLFPLLAEKVFPSLLMTHFGYELQESGQTILFNVMMFLAQMIVITIFIGLHRKHIVTAVQKRLPGVYQHLYRILIVYFIVTAFIFIYQQFVPLMVTFDYRYITYPLSLITIGILTPIVEELLFRHLIIGELGKCWGYPFMAVVSIIIFATSHFLHFDSIASFIPFMVGGIAITYVYMVSRRNILVAMTLHILTNSISQILEMLGF